MSVFTAGAVLLGAAGLAAPAASASRSPRASYRGVAPTPRAVAGTIYDQNDNGTGVGVVSQNFESSLDGYDSAAADDFKLTSKHVVKKVTVTGTYFNGVGPATSETVTLYRNAAGLPGAVKKTTTRVGADDGTGSFVIGIGKTRLRKGTYWLSVVANMDFASGLGEWGWETRGVQAGKPAAWQNPGDGFGTGCATWGIMQNCISTGGGPDFMFALAGR